jgi:hypothetical protein
LTVRLAAEGEDVFGVYDAERMGVVALRRDGDRTTAAVELVIRPDIAQARELVLLVSELPAGALYLETRDELVRHAARAAGYGGSVRAAVQRGAGAPALELTEQIEGLLPGSTARVLPRGGLLRRWSGDATAGMSGMRRIEVATIDAPPIKVLLPEAADTIAETIALSVDTIRRVHARFGRAVDYVRTVSFDQSGHGFATGKTAGSASPILGLIHLNASYASVDRFEVFSGQRESRTPRRARRAVPEPWMTIDGVVAHELWHKLEMAWEARAYRETIEFRREIGRWFGLETLEQVMHDDTARVQLALGVSAYATTNPREATAELFKLWWCGPPPTDSLPARFGALVESFFPPS